MSRQKFIASFSLLLLFLLLNFGQIVGQIRFVNYDYQNGLQLNTITHLAEDSLGILWIGSPQGLARYDGVQFTHFEPNQADSNAIAGSDIAKIVVAADGRVWIALHEGGLSIYDHQSNTFHSRTYSPSDQDQFPRYSVIDFAINETSQKIYLISVQEGVFEMDMETFQSRKVLDVPKPYAVCVDPKAPEYLYYSSNGFHRFHIPTKKSEKLGEITWHGMKVADNLLLGYSWSPHVFFYDLNTRRLNQIEDLSDDINRDVMLVDSTLWLTTYFGIQTFDLRKKKWTLLNLQESDAFAINNSHIYSILQDTKKNIWLGTGDGLSVIRPELQDLQEIDGSDMRYVGLIKTHQPNIFYAASYFDEKLLHIDAQNKRIDAKNVLNNDAPSKIVKRGKTYWVACKNSIQYFSEDWSRLQVFSHPQYDSIFKVPSPARIQLAEDASVWIVKTKGKHLIKIDQENEVTVHRVPNLSEDAFLRGLNVTNNGVWLGTSDGLYYFDLSTHEFSNYSQIDPIIGALGPIEKVRLDTINNELWVLASRSGAHRFQLSENGELSHIKSYHQKDGLATNRPKDIVVTASGEVILGTLSGLSIFQRDLDRMLSFDKMYGWKNLGAYLYDDGKYIYTMGKGLYRLDLEKFAQRPKPPQALIDGVKVTGANTVYHPKSDSMYTFSFHQNNFLVSLSAVDLSFGHNLNFRYRLSSENPWVVVNNPSPKVLISELQPGKYLMEVEAAHQSGEWGRKRSFSFKIIPPIWQETWFLLLSSFLILVLNYAIFKVRENQIKRISSMETKMAELESESLRAQMNPHFIFNSLNSIKSFIINNRRDEAADYLTIFSELIRSVLRNSKEELILLSQELEALALYMDIENLRLKQKFNYEIKISEDIMINNVFIQPLTMQPLVENAIWHGFVHKTDNGHLTIQIDKKKEQLLIMVIDDGVGREVSRKIEAKHRRKRSYGIAITKRRLSLTGTGTNIEVIDLYDDSGNPAGTKAIIKTRYIEKSE